MNDFPARDLDGAGQPVLDVCAQPVVLDQLSQYLPRKLR
jgi:hypothetical protein